MGHECPLWVIDPRANLQEARLLYPTKLPRRRFAVEAVTGHIQTHASQQTTVSETNINYDQDARLSVDGGRFELRQSCGVALH
jgi:hypothetical protein